MKLQITTKITDDTEEFERKFINKFNEIAIGILNDARDYAPVDFGNLRRQIIINWITPTHAKIISNANYSSYMEFGTKPHVIKPKVKKALRWSSGKKGSKSYTVSFSKYVNHPGTTAIPYMTPARNNAERKLKDLFK